MSLGHASRDDLSGYSMLDLFRMDARDQSRVLTDGLLRLERRETDPATLDALMRAVHSVKGAAAIVGSAPVMRLAHALEDLFVAAQRGTLKLDAVAVDTLLAGVDLLPCLAEADPLRANHDAQLDDTVAALAALLARPAPAAAPVCAYAREPAPQEAQAPAGTTIDDELLALAGQARLDAHQLQPWIAGLQRFRRQQRSAFEAFHQLIEAIAANGDAELLERASLVLMRAGSLQDDLHRHIREAQGYERRAVSTATRIVDQVLALRMCRFGDGLHGLPRMVRDLARSLDKDVRLDVHGAETLVDRATLARMEAPLAQLLRNAVDHGMESPPERSAAGKPPRGTIRLEARHRGGMLSIEVADDGRGVDPERIRRAAIERHLAAPAFAAELSTAELMEFLFLPGFTLKEQANQISGRGVGMDVVHEAVRAQNGTVRAESRPGQGFRTVITLPLTQSIVHALVVEVLDEAYALPIARIERVLRVPAATVVTLSGRQVIEVDGAEVGLVAAAQVLELGESAAQAVLPVVMVGAGRERYGLVVDAIRGEQSLTVQPLEPIFGKLRDVAAAALLDDGKPVLILDVPDMLQSIARLQGAGTALRLVDGDGGGGPAHSTRRVLVADDSLTVREMQRKILTARGYHAEVAVDGIDAWHRLRADAWDLLITDVDMPRLDGIGLVARIRQDTRLQGLPVMIVSYKDRLDDHVRGLEAGADYYLAKGAFDDATLLEAVRDLIGAPEDGDREAH